MEQVWGEALGSRSSFEEQLCTAALNSSFEELQLWGAALGINSRERLRRVLRKKAAVILHLHIFTSADLDLHTFTSADTTSSHLHIC